MKEHPILFNTEMVHAILEEQKTQTRRIVNQVRGFEYYDICSPCATADSFSIWWHGKYETVGVRQECPFGKVGDHLWVRETWQHSNHPHGPLDKSCDIFYREEYFDDPHGMDGEKSPEGKYRFWKPSIHMPRWASRILLEITDVRVERLNDINDEDAEAEGIVKFQDGKFANYLSESGYALNAKSSYASLWESINGTGSWDANPWVWVIEFKVVKS